MGKKIKPIIIAVILVSLLAGYYFYLMNREKKQEEAIQITAVQSVLLKNLERDYPPTPKEVVKYYSEITKCLYNEHYSEEQFEQLADKMLALYDEELLQNNPREQYIKSLKNDVDIFEENGYTITSFTPSTSTDVETSFLEGREYAKLYCTYTIKVEANYSTSMEIFELRKDQNGHWKILGFKIADEQ